MDQTSLMIFSVVVLVLSATFHEYMHAWMADRLGDHTARDLGRLTINPLAHLDWFGSVFLPLLLVMSGTPFVFGYAKPVPFNPYNLRDAKWGPAKVAAAGPLANLLLALGFGIVLRFMPGLDPRLVIMFTYIVLINLVLMVFNLIPIPPLDGSKIITPLLPYHLQERFLRLEPYGMFLVVFFMIMGMELIWLAVSLLFRLIVGG
jgi:Zn-dependent protease